MNRLTNAAKYAAIIMSLIVTVTMVSGCKKNNTDVSSELNKSDIDTFALIWNEAADKAFAGILGKIQLEIIKEAGSISTFIDKDSQLKHIQSVVCELNEELDVVKTNAAGKMKAYIVTGISAGLILVIVLI
mgnify:FL=1